MFLAGVVLVVGLDAFKRVMLADDASYESSSIVEYQGIVSWDDTISIRVNRGMLPAGTAHVHVFDENDASTYAGTLTLG